MKLTKSRRPGSPKAMLSVLLLLLANVPLLFASLKHPDRNAAFRGNLQRHLNPHLPPHHLHQRQQQQQQLEGETQQPVQQQRRRRRYHHKDYHHDDESCAVVKEYFDGRESEQTSESGRTMVTLEKKIAVSNQSSCFPYANNRSNIYYNGKTCCSLEDEPILHELSSLDLRARVNETTESLKSKLRGVLSEYREYASKLLMKLKSEAIQVLTSDFNLPSNHVHEVVGHLNQQLEEQFLNGNVDLLRTLEHFFDSIYALSYYYILHDFDSSKETPAPDPVHRNCTFAVKISFKGQSLFSTWFRSSFGYMSTLKSVMSVTEKIVDLTGKIDLTEHCQRALTRMTYCSKCAGTVVVRPCLNLCYKVVAGCLHDIVDIRLRWTAFIQILSRFIGQARKQNFEATMEIFPEKLKDVLIDYIIEAEQTYSRVFNQCGTVKSTDTKWNLKNFDKLRERGEQMNMTRVPSGHRSVRSRPDELGFLTQGREMFHDDQKLEAGNSETNFLSGLQVLILEVGEKWPYARIPDQMCEEVSHVPRPTDSSVNPDVDDFDVSRCWNGTSVGEYIVASVKNRGLNKESNPEMLLVQNHNIPYIEDLIENNTVIMMKKTTASSFQFMEIPLEYSDISGDYNGFISGSGEKPFTDDDDDDVFDYSSGFMSGYGSDFNDTLVEEENKTSTPHRGDFIFSDSTTHRNPSSASSSSVSVDKEALPSASPPPGLGSGAPSLTSHLSVILASLTVVAIFCSNFRSTLDMLANRRQLMASLKSLLSAIAYFILAVFDYLQLNNPLKFSTNRAGGICARHNRVFQRALGLIRAPMMMVTPRDFTL